MNQSQDSPASDRRHNQSAIDPARWLSALPGDLPIRDINIPGSHNAAAIDIQKPTRWACQRHSITEQLQKGIRLLDIRLKPLKLRRSAPVRPNAHARGITQGPPGDEAGAPEYEFVTCHGRLGPFGANEFQSLQSLLEECTSFLKAHPGETIVMTLQIDDWRRAPGHTHPEILKTLRSRLTRLPLLISPHMPTLNECRGKIFLINRINDDPALGVPIDIPDNTPGATLQPTAERQYQVYVQDQYKKLNRRDPEAHKLRLTIEAFKNRPPGALLLNFASGTRPFGRFVYIMKDLSTYFADPPQTVGPPQTGAPPQAVAPPQTVASPQTGDRPATSRQFLGWIFLDYPFGTHREATPDLPAQIITSNYRQ